MRLLKTVFAVLALCVVSGCQLVVMNPAGDVASQQADLIVYATVLMCIVIVPVILLTLFFAFHYRERNEEARYEPDWDHSISLEIVIWSVPLAIIICLAGLTWVATHRLNPYDDLTRISETQAVPEGVTPLQIQAVALDWKWMFIYPEYGVATINEVAVEVDRPVEWHLTSSTVMNAFYIPDMSGMIYAMAGMQTEMNNVINAAGEFEGFASHYSGAGFSDMRFTVQAGDRADFDTWIENVRAEGGLLDRAAFLEADQPSVAHPVTYYGSVEDGLWNRILNQCVGDDQLCMDDMMMVDALGGGGLEGLFNRQMFAGICSEDDPGLILALLKPEMRAKEEQIMAAAFGEDLLPDVPSLTTKAN
ncbi:MAG: ubiquinol oxidase subunit II [Pseudomonadota bacterium]